jgi:hypothetical protein
MANYARIHSYLAGEFTDEEGKFDLRVPGTYTWGPPKGLKAFVSTLGVLIAHDSLFRPNTYGGLPMLPVGTELGYFKRGVLRIVPRVIRCNAEWMLFTENVNYEKFGGGNIGAMSVQWYFKEAAPTGVDLIDADYLVMHHGDYLQIKIQDDLSGLLLHDAMLQGCLIDEA